MANIDIAKFFSTDLPLAIESHADEARAINARFQIGVTGATGGDWTVDLTSKTGPGCKAGKVADPDCTITILDSDFQILCENPDKNALQLFFAGKLKVGGNQQLVIKLGKILAYALPR